MPEHSLSLPEGEVHLWYFQTDRFLRYAMQKALRFLDADEYQRYSRYKTHQKRHQFVMGRAFLKQVLAWYLAKPPEEIQLLYTNRQKPYMEGNLIFNMSHSGRHLFIAVAKHALGVDIQEEEAITEEHVFQGLTWKEQQKVKGNSIFPYWVLKEALWKADNQLNDPSELLEVFDRNVRDGLAASFSLNTWNLGYFKPIQNLHVGWAVHHPRPVLRFNGTPLKITSTSKPMLFNRAWSSLN